MTVREYIVDLQVRLGNYLDWFLDGARLLGNFQWLDFTIPQAIFTGIFFWGLYLAIKGEEYDRYSNFSHENINEPGYLEAKNLVELNVKFFLNLLFNMFSAFVVIGVVFLLLFNEVNNVTMYSWIFIAWLLIGIGTYNRRKVILKDRESLIEEYESMPEKIEEHHAEEEPLEKTDIEAETLVEDVLHEFKVSDSENCRIFESKLIIDGASYSDMGDYSWFFTLANENFPALYTALTGQTDLPDDVTAGLKQYLLENGATVTQLKEVCEANNIEYGFTNYM